MYCIFFAPIQLVDIVSKYFRICGRKLFDDLNAILLHRKILLDRYEVMAKSVMERCFDSQ